MYTGMLGLGFLVELRLHIAAVNSKGDNRNEGSDIPAEIHAPEY